MIRTDLLRRRGFWIGVAAIALLIVALLVSRLLGPLTVSVAADEMNVPEQVFGLGVVGARVQSNLAFKVPGVLVALAADQGDRVRAGQVLARLDARDVAAQLAVATAGVAQARANIDKGKADVASAAASLANAEAVAGRSGRLVESGVVSEEQRQTDDAAVRVATANRAVADSAVVVADAALRSAQAQQASAQATLSYYTLAAPYEGWIVSRNLELGSVPNPGQSVFTMVAADTVWVLAYVDERLAGRLRVGQPATITLRSDHQRPLPGHVARIEIQSDPVNEERLVDVAFDRIPPDIHMAEQAEVVITTDILPRAVAVAPTAVGDLRGNRGFVWIVQDGRLERRRVTLGGELLDGRLPIVGGLPDGAQVVTAPPGGLREGRAVRISQAPEP